MTDEKKKRPTGILLKLRAYFTTGMLVLAPTMVSIWIFLQMFRFFDGIFGKLYKKYVFRTLDWTPPGLGLITLIIFVLIVGILARLYVGKKMFALWEKVINHVPLINRIYIAVRQLSDSFVKGGSIIFQFPVIVQYPRKGLYSIGFLTRRCEGPFCQIVGTEVSTVFIPTTPNPTSGVLIFVPNEDIIPLEMSVEDAMKLIISAGTVTPDIKLPVIKADQ
ncbi:DUF502 domain-containing protein [Candidatus Latescibacterota bacterium]